ncbi:hypothetical protein RHS01_00353 [Rhizoctonia solani]|uniref:CNNM transmembrane domain-containing protein n=1 Tax=Rhizoctonia solani TaxID=456999 RepID=A0A8H7IPE8_9AGAM|nr:hypothetical protein RHS01_00353 [Rhizoctonia solani]
MSSSSRTRSNRAVAGLFFIVSQAVRASPMFKMAPEEPEEPIGSAGFWWKMVMSMGLVLLGGAFAGLTLGLMGLDELHLRVLATSSDDPNEKKNANKVLRLMKKGRHWVLVVLLLGNVIVNESLPIFLDSAIGGGVAAVAISTVMIVIFGHRPRLRSTAPVAWPIAKLLDWVLGNGEANTYKKAELKSFLQFHREGAEPLRDDEASQSYSAQSLRSPGRVGYLYPEALRTVDGDELIYQIALVRSIARAAGQRIPIIHSTGSQALNQLFPTLTYEFSTPGFGLLTGRSHLLLISENPGEPHGALGVITLEDIIEEIISEEIVDETDRYEDNRHKRRAKRQSTAAIMRGIVEREKRRWSFNSYGDNAAGSDTPRTSSRAPTPKPTPSREPMEITRLLPIDEHVGNGHYEGPSSYGATTPVQNPVAKGHAERGRDRDRSQSRHRGSFTDSPTRS